MRSLVTYHENRLRILHTAAEALRPAGTLRAAPEAPHGQSGPPRRSACRDRSPELPLHAESDRPWLAHYPVCVPKTLKYPAVPDLGPADAQVRASFRTVSPVSI